MTTRMYVGESRTIEFTVSDTRGEAFSIGESRYKISKDGEVYTAGLLDIDESTLSMRFQPTEAGLYTLMLEYVIGSDIMRDKYLVEVVEL